MNGDLLWRSIENDRVAGYAKEIAFTNFTLGSLSKLCGLYPGWMMNWQLSGGLVAWHRTSEGGCVGEVNAIVTITDCATRKLDSQLIRADALRPR